MNAATVELLDDVVAFVRRYVVLTEDQATAVALWIPHTHTVDALGITPYLAITSAEKGSGKTLLLEILDLLVARPWLTGSVSAATLARKIHQAKPTLLLDEGDTAFNGDREYAETLRGVLNTGFKASGTYSRCAGTNGTNLKVQDFRTFCPKAIAGIDRLPDTVADRAVSIRLKRKTPNERVERKRERRVGAESAPLRERIEQWAEEWREHLAQLELAGLEQLPDRANDIWEPLLGIAYVASEKWYVRARQAAIALSGRGAVEDHSRGVQLLADIRTVFDERGVDKLSSAILATALHEIEESPWAEWKNGKPITPSEIARLLKRYETSPHVIRVDDGTTPRGYRREQFEDVWLRYLADPPSETATPQQSAWLSEKEAGPNRNGRGHVAVTKPGPNPHEHRNVAGVAVENGGVGADAAALKANEEAILAEAQELVDAGDAVWDAA